MSTPLSVQLSPLTIERETIPVLIVGGGVVGLSASLFLAKLGVRTVLVERHRGTSLYPKARGVNARTMELMRELGLEEAIRNIGAQLTPSVGVYSGSSLVQVMQDRGAGGWWIKALRKKIVRGTGSKRSPTRAGRCTQDALEPLLLETARARGVDARFYTELLSFEEKEEGVEAVLLDRASGTQTRVTANFLLAADGAHSPVRQALGLKQIGENGIHHQINIFFRADLKALVQGREFSMCLIENSGRRGLFASVNNSDLWIFHLSYYPERGERKDDFTRERCRELVCQAIGLSELEIEIKGLSPWEERVGIAEKFNLGRVFLAGDAAHVMPPWGGFGANTGIQDAHNLAWKLAAVLHRQAGVGLLATYDEERRPVAQAVAEIARGLSDDRGLISIGSPFRMFWKMRSVFPYLSVGYGYTSPAIISEGKPVPGPGVTELRGRPGTRAPHLWLSLNGKRVSTLDLFGRGFVLFAGQTGAQWTDAAQSLREEFSVRLDTFQINRDLWEYDRAWHRSFEVRSDGATLVRPDGFVAWRAKNGTGSPLEQLRRTLHAILAFSNSD